MVLYSLHADFNRDGALTASRPEYNDRNQRPGAVMTPNLDADGVRIPDVVSCGSAPTLDSARTTKSMNDNDLLPVAVIAKRGTDPSQHKVELRISQSDAQKVKVYDHRRRLITGAVKNSSTIFTLNFTNRRADLFLEAITFNASPDSPGTSSPTVSQMTRTNLLPVIAKLASGFHREMVAQMTQTNLLPVIELHLWVFDRNDNKLLERDRGLFSISPLILLGDTNPAERLYMCDIRKSRPSISDNWPSFRDVQTAMPRQRRGRGIRFVPVPLSVSRRDSWLQDQFQVGYSQRAGALEKVIFHLPRLRSDTALATSDHSLACMVTDHFPSSNLGVFNDFWTRNISIKGVDRGRLNIPFVNTVELLMLFEKVYKLYFYLMRIVKEVDPRQYKQLRIRIGHDLVSIIKELNELSEEVINTLKDAIKLEEDPVRREKLNNTRKDIESRIIGLITALLKKIKFRKDEALEVKTQNLNLALDRNHIQDIYDNLLQLHSSHNLGGNIVVTPPMSTAPLGKIVIGNSRDNRGRCLMDPSLTNFLKMQQVQPVIEVDTSWLQVGHVDEIISFGIRNAEKKFPVILASPRKAIDILDEIFRLNTEDLSIHAMDRNLEPFKLGDFSMARGPHPVTAMLRGKHWLQLVPHKEFPIVMPPKIYQDMNWYYGNTWSTRPFYPVAWAKEHYYNARISVREVLYFGRKANSLVQGKMDTIKGVLLKALEEMPVLELPVLFDNNDPEFVQATAFTPDLVNFQIVNNYLFMPRPFGPRMSVDSTIKVLEKVLDKSFHHYLNEQFFKQKGLNRTWCWIIDSVNQLGYAEPSLIPHPIRERGPYFDNPVRVNLDWLAEQFADGFFPEIDMDAIKERIRTAGRNRGKFLANGDLRPGWQEIVIPENKVDVFEAYTHIILEGTGLKIKWVDSWYYHLRGGGIHCGTNVIRTPVTTQKSAWWNLR